MIIVAQVVSIMLMSASFFWGGIPMGLAFHFSPLLAGVITMVGAEAAVFLVLLLGAPIQALLIRRFPGWIERTRKGRVGRVWQSYGMPGLGLISPVLPGAPQSAAIALILGARPAWIFLWVSAGIWIWGGLATGAVVLGSTALTRFLPQML